MAHRGPDPKQRSRQLRPRPRRPQQARPGGELSSQRRLVAFSVLIGLIAATLVYRMFALQGDNREALINSGRQQRLTTYAVEAQRGSILDRNGVELAVSIPRRNLAVDMTKLSEAGIVDWADFDAFARLIATDLGVQSATISQRLKKSSADDLYVILARNVSISQTNRLLDKLRKSKTHQGLLTAIIVERSSERINPAGDSGLRILGKLGVDGPSRMAGIERSFDRQLRGVDGKSRVELKRGSKGGISGWSAIVTGEGRVDLSRRGGALPGSEDVIKEAVPGSSVQLTIDRAIQHDVERILIDGASKAGARSGVAIVGRPTTGELLAVASVEVDSESSEMRISTAPLAFANAYQAGSVFKLVTVSAGIESGAVKADTIMTVPDTIRVSDRTFRDHETHETEPMTVREIVAQSSNVGTIKIAQKLGKDRLHQALRNFGFGERTGISHPAESPGLVPDVSKWTNPDLAASSIGTHESATALQLWAAYNVVANRGMYVKPRLVSAVLHPDGSRDVPQSEKPRRVISERTAEDVSNILQSVITEGTGREWTLPGYSVAAKTGTSRIPAPKVVDPTDGYLWADGRHHSLAAFTGFLPASRPQVSITVILDDVNDGLYGSTAAGPIFSQLARLSIRELGIAPDGPLHEDDSEELLPGTTRTTGGRVRTQPAARPVELDEADASSEDRQ